MRPGERIRHRRLELGWTQDELAKRATISKGFLSDVENGKRGIGAETLLDLARVLGVSLDYLMVGADSDESIRRDVEIPSDLAEFAATKGLSFSRTLMLLKLQRQILAHRSSRDARTATFDWTRFYDSIQDFL